MVSMLLGNPMSGVLEDKEDKKEGEDEEDPEIVEARREAEEKRNEKYRKMEEERENMRQGIRDKYHIQKKEVPVEDPGLEGRLGRKKTDGTDGDPNNPNGNGGAGFPKNLEDLKARVTELPGTVMTTVTDAKDKCQLQ